MSGKLKIKLNRSLQGKQAGTIITVLTDDKKVPLDRYWRDRLEDSKTDGCVEIVATPAKTTKKEAN